MIVFDTNILIEILKGNTQTLEQISTLSPPFAVSSITAMELIFGARNKKEVKQIEQLLSKFHYLSLNNDIDKTAFSLVKEYAKSHTLDIPDALIAATTLQNKATLLTYNTKDFRFIPNLILV